MSAYGGKHETKCPYCGQMAPYETVDIGVGEQQCAPAFCVECGARQMMPEDAMKPPKQATPEERMTCWWRGP